MGIRLHVHGAVVLMALALSACGATIVKDAPPPPLDWVVAEASSPHVKAQLAWVLVSEGEGSWAEEAVWDEYLVRVVNTSPAPVEISGVVVEDSGGQVAVVLDTRSDLIKASKETAKRYREQGVSIYTGLGGGGMTALGMGSTAAGLAYGSTLSLGVFGTAASSSAAFGAAAGLIISGPVLASIDVARAVRNDKMNKRIQLRHTALPVVIGPGDEKMLDLFFAITPAPNMMSITYRQDGAENHVDIDTRQALAGLHLPPPKPGDVEALAVAQAQVSAPGLQDEGPNADAVAGNPDVGNGSP